MLSGPGPLPACACAVTPTSCHRCWSNRSGTLVLPHAGRIVCQASASDAGRSAEQQGPQQHTPLLDAVLERGSRLSDVPFHVPGHKRGRVPVQGLPALLGPDALRHDLTELAGAIQEAQQLAAAAFGADATWFLVNGSTVGIHAAVMATCGPETTLIVARNCHLSAFSAMVLSGCPPLWLTPESDAVHGVAHCPTPESLAAAFETARRQGVAVGGVLMVSPTYFGAVARIEELAAICHTHNVPLLVDEAHGAHFCTHPAFPPSALQCGADFAIQSTHKTLTSLTQSAMLHLRGPRVSAQRISRALQVLQSSSPSYLLMASLDAARAWAQGPGVWDEPLQAAEVARAGLTGIAGLRLLQHGSAGTEASVAAYDPLRLVVNVHGLGVTGFAAAEWLEAHHSIVPELATTQLVVLVLGPGSKLTDASALVAAFQALSSCRQGTSEAADSRLSISGSTQRTQQQQPRPQQLHPGLVAASLPPVVMHCKPRDAFFADSEAVPLQQAVGRVSAELLCPYPPGVPVLFPGEVVTAEAAALLLATLAAGGTVTGANDCTLATISVLRGV